MLAELCWDALKLHSTFSLLVMCYKLINNLLPEYLCNIICVRGASDVHSTRQAGRAKITLATVTCATVAYSKSFLPQLINLWNALPGNLTTSSNLIGFKTSLATHLHCCSGNSLLLSFSLLHEGKLGRILTDIRIGISPLRYQLYTNNISDNPFCAHCCDVVESPEHFFFICSAYSNIRLELRDKIRDVILLMPLEPQSASKLNGELVKLLNWRSNAGRAVPLAVFPNLLSLCINGLKDFVSSVNNQRVAGNAQTILYRSTINYMYKSKRFC